MVSDCGLGDTRQTGENQLRRQRQQGAGSLARRLRQSLWDLIELCDRAHLNSEPDATAGGFAGVELQFVHPWVSEHHNALEVWLDVSEELELFATHLGDVEKEPRDVAAGTRQGGDPPARHWIRLEIHGHDGNRLRCLSDRLDRLRAGSEDDIDVRSHELCREGGVLLKLPWLRSPGLEMGVFSDHIALLAPLAKRPFEWPSECHGA